MSSQEMDKEKTTFGDGYGYNAPFEEFEKEQKNFGDGYGYTTPLPIEGQNLTVDSGYGYGAAGHRHGSSQHPDVNGNPSEASGYGYAIHNDAAYGYDRYHDEKNDLGYGDGHDLKSGDDPDQHAGGNGNPCEASGYGYATHNEAGYGYHSEKNDFVYGDEQDLKSTKVSAFTSGSDMYDPSGEREGIGGWISEEGQQDNLAVGKDERQGVGGWINDVQDHVNSTGSDKQDSFMHMAHNDGSSDFNNNSTGTHDYVSPQFNDQPTGAAVEGSTGRRRRSRWEPQTNGDSDGQEASESGGKRRKSRWAAEEPKSLFQLPDFVKELTGGMHLDPEVQALNIKLLDVTRRLQSGQVLEEIEDGNRSPSPEPIYDNMGIRVNTREFRSREKLTRERQEIISELIKRNPAFKPPADYRPPKLYKKLFIPVKEYPGYNFIGLIIGPRGNTQKRMERETGAKIVIRGKGSAKEGRLPQKRDMRPDPGENEELHVLVEADNADSLERAAGMVEKLLVPVDEGLNEHKRAQLRELATLNGTIRDEEFCRICGEPGHRQYACSARNSTFKSDVVCRICGDGGHPTVDCPVKGSSPGKMDDEYKSFLAELGGGLDSGSRVIGDVGSSHQLGPTLALPGPQGGNPPWLGNGVGARLGLPGSSASRFSKDGDDLNLYVGYLPQTIDDDGLIRLFSPFGKIEDLKLIKDRVTGVSKGYGFVKFCDAAAAAQAVMHMNGYRLDGKVLAVRVAGKPPGPGGAPGGLPGGPPGGTPSGPPGGPQSMGFPQQQQAPPLSSQGYMGPSPPWNTPQTPYPAYGPPAGPPGGQAPFLPYGSQGLPSSLHGAPTIISGPQGPDIPGPQGPPSMQVPQGPPSILGPQGPQSIPGSQGPLSVPVPQGPPNISGPQGHPPNMAMMPRHMGFFPPPQGPPGAFPPFPGPFYGAPPPPSSSMPLSAGSGAPPPWAMATNMSTPPVPPNSQQRDGVESEYEKFMSEMGR